MFNNHYISLPSRKLNLKTEHCPNFRNSRLQHLRRYKPAGQSVTCKHQGRHEKRMSSHPAVPQPDVPPPPPTAAERLLLGQQRVLEQVALGAPLLEVLTA